MIYGFMILGVNLLFYLTNPMCDVHMILFYFKKLSVPKQIFFSTLGWHRLTLHFFIAGVENHLCVMIGPETSDDIDNWGTLGVSR